MVPGQLAAVLKTVLPTCKDSTDWSVGLVPAMDAANINTRLRIAAFLAQVSHESGELNRLVENLNYTHADRIAAVWPLRFNVNSAGPYVGNPEKLANFVYANRMGNGGPASGEGWKYRGRGLIGITGFDAYKLEAAESGYPLVDHPELLQQPHVAAIVSANWWNRKGLNDLADMLGTSHATQAVFSSITGRVNGGQEGAAARWAYFLDFDKTLGAAGLP